PKMDSSITFPTKSKEPAMKLKLVVAAAAMIAVTTPVYADETTEVAVASVTTTTAERPRITLPMLKAGGIPQGQVMVISNTGTKIMSAARAAEDPSLKLSLNKGDSCAIR